MKKTLVLCLAAVLPLVGLRAAEKTIGTEYTISLNSPDGLYRLGDTIIVSAKLIGQYDRPIDMTVFENGIQKQTIHLGVLSGTSIVYRDVRTQPTAVYLDFRDEGSWTNPTLPKDIDYNDSAFRIGYVAGAEGFKPGFKAPLDLHRYWKREIRKMRKSEMKVSLERIDSPEKGYECFSIGISMPEGPDVHGYLAKPQGASKGTLPIAIYLHAAGQIGKTQASARGALEFAKMGAVSIDINAHGMLNGMPKEYYDSLQAGPLANYSRRPVLDRENYYFRKMILRSVRTLDYMCTDPLWDGKRVMLTGESQGGFQSFALAGIDKRVTHVVARVPAGVGNGGSVLGRSNAWPWPLEVSGVKTPISGIIINPLPEADERSAEAVWKVAPYFDGALLVKGCKAEFLVEIGMIDTTCPPAEILSGTNGIKGNVILSTFPYRPHHQGKPAPQYLEQWKKTVLAKRKEYYRSILGAAE